MKSKDPGGKKQSTNPTVDKSPSGKKKSLAEVDCYVCGEYGHYAWDCKDRKVAAKALIAKSGDKAVDEDGYEKNDEEDSVYVTTSEKILFSKDDVLLDSQASVNVFYNQLLLKNVRKSERQVLLNGVQSGASGVRINQEGDFKAVGRVYFSSEATANILSYAVMVDEGNAVSYDQGNDRFELRPAGSNLIYSFCRKNVPAVMVVSIVATLILWSDLALLCTHQRKYQHYLIMLSSRQSRRICLSIPN